MSFFHIVVPGITLSEILFNGWFIRDSEGVKTFSVYSVSDNKIPTCQLN